MKFLSFPFGLSYALEGENSQRNSQNHHGGVRSGNAKRLEERQTLMTLNSIGTATPAARTVSHSSHVTVSASLLASPLTILHYSTSTTVALPSITGISTTTKPYDPLIITTTFTPSGACTTRGMTVIDLAPSYMWQNVVFPAPSMTLTSCYPTQFYSSMIAQSSRGGIPPFKQMVCPHRWEDYKYNSTYHFCCPNGFGVVAPELKTNKQRPGKGALCVSDVASGVLVDITSYDAAGKTSIIATTASTSWRFVYAQAFDGGYASFDPTITEFESTSSSPASSIQTTLPPVSSTMSSISGPTTSSSTSSSKLKTSASLTIITMFAIVSVILSSMF